MLPPLMKSAPLLLGLLIASQAAHAQMITPELAPRHTGKTAMVCGLVERGRYAEGSEGKPTFLHMGGAFPRHTFSARIPGTARDKFSFAPESLEGKTICVNGLIVRDASRAEIEVTAPSAIKLANIK